MDSITSEPQAGFDINISLWRILTEPYTGPLLFYLRADQPLSEFFVLLIWIAVISLLASFLKAWFDQRMTGIKVFTTGIVSWLKQVPLMASIWLALLWMMIFLPLPANRIKNSLDDTILINTHSHSEYSHDGIISQESLLNWHRKNGFDAFFITDHNHHNKTLEAVNAQVNGALPSEPLILCGEEFSGTNHLTLLGLTSHFSTRGLTDQQVIDTAHAEQGVVIVAHWFDDERESIPFFVDMGVDGFEIVNQASGLSYDRRVFRDITDACTAHGLLMTGVADYHGYGSTCFAWTALKIPGWHSMSREDKQKEVMGLLREKDMNRIRILQYHDRKVYDRSLVMLNPLLNAVSYARTLSFIQVVSWAFWLMVLLMVAGKRDRSTSKRGRPGALEALSLAGSLFLLIYGLYIYGKKAGLDGYNEIYGEFGTIMIASGTGFLLYTVILWIFNSRNIRVK